MTMEHVLEFLKTNQIFTGLSMAGIVGSALYLLKSIPRLIWSFVVRHTTITLTIKNDKEAFEWIDEYFSKTKYAQRARTINLIELKTNEDKWDFSPGYGRHFFWYNYWPVVIHREMEEGDKVSHNNKRKEQFIITMLGRDRTKIVNFINQAMSLKVENENNTPVYVYSSYWRKFKKSDRSLDSIFLPQMMKTEIINDLTWFFNSKKWYSDRGIPYRRGYLFHGQPGTGKSSLVMALASLFQKPIYYINLNAVNEDNDLFDIMDVKNNSIVLIEDIDALDATIKRKEPKKEGEEEKENKSTISLSGLLNAIDGVASPEGRILIMSTNHIDRLDPALIRPGRVDKKFEFGCMKEEEILEMYKIFFPLDKNLDSIEDLIKEKGEMVAAEWMNCFMTMDNNGIGRI